VSALDGRVVGARGDADADVVHAVLVVLVLVVLAWEEESRFAFLGVEGPVVVEGETRWVLLGRMSRLLLLLLRGRRAWVGMARSLVSRTALGGRRWWTRR